MKKEKKKKSISKVALFLILSSFISNMPIKAYAKAVIIAEGLNNPAGIAIDKEGNVFVSEAVSGSSIKKIIPKSDGSCDIKTIGTNKEFNEIYGLAVNSSGEIYVSDMSEGWIYKMMPNGDVSYKSTPIFLIDINAHGIAVDKEKNILIADTEQDYITKMQFTEGNSFSKSYAGKGVINKPYEVAADDFGNIFVAEADGTIQKIKPDGTITCIVTRVFNCKGIAVDRNGNIFVTQAADGSITKLMNKKGENYEKITIATGLNKPYGVAIDNAGNIFVAEKGANDIKKINSIKVNYDANGGTGAKTIDDNCYYGTGSETVIVKANTFTRDGYVFNGWSDSADGTKINYKPNDTFIVGDSDVTLYADWKADAGTITAIDSLPDINVVNGTDKNYIQLPKTVNILLGNSTKTTVGITWNNGSPEYNGDKAGKYRFTGSLILPSGILNPNNLKATVDVITGAADNSTSPKAHIDPTAQTTPAAVIIKGTERIGETLNAEVSTDMGARVTTSAGVTYEWYRLSDKTIESRDVIGNDENYTLAVRDVGKYIKVKAIYYGKTFEDITGKIEGRQSESVSSSSSSHHHHKSDGSSILTENDLAITDKTILNSIANGWQKENDNTWKYGENRRYVIGWKKIDGLWYLFDLIGTMQTGWRKDNNKWYYLKDDGSMKIGWKLINKKWYLFDTGGAMIIGWAEANNKWYYLNIDGSMATGWIKTEGRWYYLYDDGSMACNTLISGYRVDENGVWIN